MYGWEGSFFRVQLCRSSSATSPCDGGVSCELLDVCAQDGAVEPSQPEQRPIQAPAMSVLMSLRITPPDACGTWLICHHGIRSVVGRTASGYESPHLTLRSQIGYVSASRPGLISQNCDIFALFRRCASWRRDGAIVCKQRSMNLIFARPQRLYRLPPMGCFNGELPQVGALSGMPHNQNRTVKASRSLPQSNQQK